VEGTAVKATTKGDCALLGNLVGIVMATGAIKGDFPGARLVQLQPVCSMAPSLTLSIFLSVLWFPRWVVRTSFGRILG
jgi:hypothetical protein